MPAHRTESTLVVLLLVVASFAQAAKVSSITVGVVTSFGEPLPGGKVLIEGSGFHKELVIKGRTTAVLPFGTYHFTTKATAFYWGSNRIVDVMTAQCFRPHRSGTEGSVRDQWRRYRYSLHS